MTEDPPSDLLRYAKILRGMIGQATPPPRLSEKTGVIHVESGCIFPHALVNPTIPAEFDHDLKAFASIKDLETIDVVDQAGHRRPVYRGQLVYSLLQAFRLLEKNLPGHERAAWNTAMHQWCDYFAHRVSGSLEQSSIGSIAASSGGAYGELVWMALSLHSGATILSNQSWDPPARSIFTNLARCQSPDGSFLKVRSSDNPETHWFHELVILHAAACYAIQSRDPSLEKAVAKNAEYHQEQTQPDHATNQPWALFAFLWNPATRPLADQMLHAASVQNSQSPAGISLMLLADALYCLNLLIEN